MNTEYQSGAVSPVGSIKEGWRIIGSDYWTFFGMTLVAIVILIVAAVILGLINNVIVAVISTAFGIAASNSGEAVKVSAAIVPQLISLVISFFTNIIVGAVSGMFFCGIYKAMSRKVSDGVAEFGDLFSGFQYFSSCVIVAAVLSVIQFLFSAAALLIGAALGFSALGVGMLKQNGQINPAALSGIIGAAIVFFIVLMVFNLIVSALTSFAYPLIAERELSGGQALSLSAKGGFANIGGMILLLILLILMGIGGALLCGIGILFVAPIMSASLFAAYQSVFGRVKSAYQNVPPPPPNFGNQPGY